MYIQKFKKIFYGCHACIFRKCYINPQYAQTSSSPLLESTSCTRSIAINRVRSDAIENKQCSTQFSAEKIFIYGH